MTTKQAVWVECAGEAHGNPFIDNCILCAPYWRHIPTCPDCGRKLQERRKGYYCKTCRQALKGEES